MCLTFNFYTAVAYVESFGVKAEQKNAKLNSQIWPKQTIAKLAAGKWYSRMSMLCIITLFNIDHIQCGAGPLLVTANSFRLYHVMYHQLNIYGKFGSRQSLFAFNINVHNYSLGFLLER